MRLILYVDDNGREIDMEDTVKAMYKLSAYTEQGLITKKDFLRYVSVILSVAKKN